VVFHCAAQTSAYAADSEPVKDLRLNVVPIVHLLELCHQKKFSPFIVLASTITIAGLAQAQLIDESTPDTPVTVYDLHKLFAEQYLRCYVARDLARGTSLRLANVYGHGPKSGKEDRGILNKMIRRAMDGEPLCVYQPGTFVRDYLHVQDAGLAFLLAAAHPETTNGQHFVIGTGERNTLLEAANIVASHVGDRIGIKIPVKLIPSPHPLSPIENRQYGVDSRYFREMTGWRPDIMLSKGILNVLEEAE